MLKITIPDAAFLFEKKNLRAALRESAQIVVRDARALVRNAGGSGRAYSTPSTMIKGYHVASAPGEPPASLTGALSKSISYRQKGDRVSIVDRQFYAKFLEVGAQGGSGNRVKGGKGKTNPKAKKNQKPTPSTRRVLAPRPFISRALDDRAGEIEQKIITAVDLDMKLVVGAK